MGLLGRLLMKEVFACKPCAAERGLKLIREGVDEKDRCAFCGRKRYGAWFSA